MYVIIGSHFVLLEDKFLFKCDSASNVPKCLLANSNGVSIVEKLIVKLSNTSTTFSQQLEYKGYVDTTVNC
jgi:hypothetical protein